MSNSKCCVPFCDTGYEKERQRNMQSGNRNLSLFSIPKNTEFFLKWSNKIKLEKTLTTRDKVCEKHFVDDLIIRKDTIKLKDGTLYSSDRKLPLLKSNAVPTIFPKYPSYLNNEHQKTRKSPTKRKFEECSTQIEKKNITAKDAEDFNVTNDTNNFDTNAETIPIPSSISEWKSIKEKESTIHFLFDENFNMAKRVIVSENTPSIQIYIGCAELKHEFKLGEGNNVSHILQSVYEMKTCPGSELKVPICQGFVSRRAKLCFQCVRHNRRTNSHRGINRKMSVIIKKNDTLKKQVAANRVNKKLAVSIEHLPEIQQEVVRAFLEAKVEKPQGNRYTRKWMYECILLKVKSSKTYKTLRLRRILPLPTVGTVQSYIRKLKASFGFQPKVFELLRRKAHSMDPRQRRGVLLIDEMKVSPSIKFDKNSLEFIGFTDIGKYTPQEQQNEPGDHALVIIYQPFQGSWIQAVGAFLTRNAANGHVLSQILLEAVVSIENSGFYVDCVTTDGASWNRNMWLKFGVSEEKPYCEHVMDDKRKLYFVSDFCHLIKNLWQWITNKRFIITPDGIVKLEYWAAVVQFEASKPIKAYAALNESHIKPKQFEKMNVARAYQFFSKETAAAMEFYHLRPELKGSEGTIKFIKRIAGLIHAFSSRNGKSALRKYNTPERQVILDFIEYLKKCTHLCSDSGMKGLKVTCAVAIQISDFLLYEHNYDFVMLTRLNQDNLERFFGMVRAFCGNNDHPDPQMFLLIFRLMMVYSLVKPVVGSNVTGDELFTTLIQDSELEDECESNRNRWKRINQVISNAAEEFCHLESTGSMDLTEDQRLLEFLAGYVGMKAGKLRQCQTCTRSLSVPKSEYQCSSNTNSSPSLIELRDYHNALHYPTKSLFQLVTILEENVHAVIGEKTEIQPDTFFQISERLEMLPCIPRIGCDEHQTTVTGYVTQFYLILRMHFAAKTVNRTMCNRKSAELRKLGKLVESPTAKALVQKIDSYSRSMEGVVGSIDAALNEEKNVPAPKVVRKKSRKSHVTQEEHLL